MFKFFGPVAASLHDFSLGLYHFARDALFSLTTPSVPSNEEAGQLASKSGWQKAAIVSIAPNQYFTPFLWNILNGLNENSFFILVITRGVLQAGQKDAIRDHCHHLIEGLSIGGEFSSYKTGWNWIISRPSFNEIDTLALINDSLYYPRRVSSTIGQMLMSKSSWLCLYENFENSYYAHSSLNLLRASIFRSAAFKNFWQQPVAVRSTIQNNVCLTKILLKAGFEPQPYYNARRLQGDVMTALSNKDVPNNLRDILNLTLGFKRKRKTKRMFWRGKDALALPAAEVADKLNELTGKHNSAYSVGLLCNYLYQAPLRRDLCERDVYSTQELLALMQGFSAEEKEAMSCDLQRHDKPSKYAFMYKIPERIRRWARRV